MAPEPEANADLTAFLSRKDRDKFIEDWLVEDHGIQKWKAKGMVKLIIAPLTNLAGEVAGRGLQKIHQALRKHSDRYDKVSKHFSNLLLIKIECEKTKTKYSEKYLIPPAGEDPENWNKLNEQTRVWIKQLEKLDLIALSLDDLKATIRLNLDQPNLKKDSAPSRWLRPYNAFIPLTGRDRETDQLNEWRDAGEVFSWKIIIGEGGIGKTRLAQEFARSCIESGWDSGFLFHDTLDKLVNHQDFSKWTPLADTLIIVDYAATKQESLKKLLHQCGLNARNEDGQEQPAKLRLLLLERHADDEQGWVKTLLSVGQGKLNDEISDALHPVLELKPPQQKTQNETMLDILQATLDRWEKLTNETAPELPAFTEADFEQLQTHTEGRPLYLQMAALHTCEIG
ncbi:MAG: hypothetical protein IID17_05870, partial [Nitrospinae bacterium]|nr:hypothetical protein [Nitrospinota bacterium]